MSPKLIFIAFAAFTLLLFLISFITSRNAKNETYFIGERKSPWFVVAYGMIGACLSGVTFISIPGDVYWSSFSYMMVVFGYILGYVVIAYVLLPVFYGHKVTTIYTYLQQRFGNTSYKVGSSFFLVSKLFGAAGRLFLVVFVLQNFIFDQWNIPFWVTAFFFILLVVLYTFKGGVKTVIWTDTLQTTFMIISLILCFILIIKELNVSFSEMMTQVFNHEYSKMIITDISSPKHYLKQFFGGAFIAMTMTGLDQDMMQKNLSCKNLKDSQKNVMTLSFILIPVNFLFLVLGISLYIFAASKGIEIPVVNGELKTDLLFPTIMINHLSPVAVIVFLIGLISAAYSSGDGAITALTTSFCIDFLGFETTNKNLPAKRKQKIRILVHFAFAALIIFLILIFNKINDTSVINTIFIIAGYTYGPLLGLFTLGLFTKVKFKEKLVPVVTLAAPIICYLLSLKFNFGFTTVIVNGVITILGLLLITEKQKPQLIENQITKQ